MVFENSNTVCSVHLKWILFLLFSCITWHFSLSIDVVFIVFLVTAFFYVAFYARSLLQRDDNLNESFTWLNKGKERRSKRH